MGIGLFLCYQDRDKIQSRRRPVVEHFISIQKCLFISPSRSPRLSAGMCSSKWLFATYPPDQVAQRILLFVISYFHTISCARLPEILGAIIVGWKWSPLSLKTMNMYTAAGRRGVHLQSNTSRLEAVHSHSLVINSYPGMYLGIHLKGGIVCLNQYFPSNHDGMIDKYSPYRVGDITIWMMINDRYWQLCSLALVTNYFQE